MKKLPLALILLPVLGTIASGAPMKDRTTAQELTAQRKQSEAAISATAIAPADDARGTSPSQQSLIGQSVILSDGANWTLVPRGAVLHLPEAHRSKVGTRPVGNLLSWREFSILNHAWLGTEQISLRQAEGVESFDERRVAFWPKQDRVMVATYLEGPISVVAVKASQETASNH